MVEGRIVSIGSRATGEGEHPVLLVQLPDGARHQVVTLRTDIRECRPGSRIALQQAGRYLKVGLMGCRLPTDRRL